jgi:hypothetical protein
MSKVLLNVNQRHTFSGKDRRAQMANAMEAKSIHSRPITQTTHPLKTVLIRMGCPWFNKKPLAFSRLSILIA